MRLFRPSQRPPGAPLSSALGVRAADPATSEDGEDRSHRPQGNATAVLLMVGIVLLAAALVIPSRAPSAVPSGVLEPVSPPTTGAAGQGRETEPAEAEREIALDPTSPGDDLWVTTERGEATTDGASARTRGGLEGSTSASVAGDDLARAERAEARRVIEARQARNRAIARKKNRARRAARARAAARRAAAERRRAARAPAPAAPVQQRQPAVAPPPARSAPTRSAPTRRPAKRAPAERSPSGSAVAEEFTGGL